MLVAKVFFLPFFFIHVAGQSDLPFRPQLML